MRCKKVICLFKMWRRSLQWGSCCKPCFNSGCSVWSLQLCLMHSQLVHLVRYSFTMFDFYEKMCSFHAESCARLPLNITTEEILPMLSATFESTWSQNGQILKIVEICIHPSFICQVWFLRKATCRFHAWLPLNKILKNANVGWILSLPRNRIGKL